MYRKTLTILILMSCISAGCVNAELNGDVEQNFEKSTLIVSGMATENSSISLQILAPGFKTDDIWTRKFDAVPYAGQTKSNEAGEYFFEFPFDKNTGNYEVMIGDSGTGETISIDYKYVNVEANRAAIIALGDSSRQGFDEFSDVLNSNKANLGFTSDIETVAGTGWKKILYNYVKEITLNENDGNFLISAYEKSLLCDALNEGNIENIDDYLDVFSNNSIKEDYDTIAKNIDVKKDITSRMYNRNINDFEMLDSVFEEAVILATVEYGSGFGTAKKICNKYKSEIGLSKDITDKIAKGIIGNVYDNYMELKSAISDLQDSEKKMSGGGSGGNSSKASSSIPVPIGSEIKKDNEKIEPVKKTFDDLNSVPWASEAILALADKGIIHGKSEKEFFPNETVKREEFVKMIIEVCEVPLYKSESGYFSDVAENDWFFGYVNAAYEKDICKGIGENLFGTGRMITRQDMAVMLSALIIEEPEEKAEEFADEDMISEYAKESVHKLSALDIINGKGDDVFDPTGYATRAEAACMIYKAFDILKEGC